MPKEVFMEVFEEVAVELDSGARSTRLAPIVRFALTIAFYATGGYQTNILQDRVSQQSASRCIREVTNALERKLCKKWIRFPKTAAERDAVKQQFQTKFGVPGVIGCIDGTHVAMIAPRVSEHLYVDRMHQHSLNVQLVCDYELQILSVDAKHPGSSHDAAIWKTSADRRHLQELHSRTAEEDSWLLGTYIYYVIN